MIVDWTQMSFTTDGEILKNTEVKLLFDKWRTFIKHVVTSFRFFEKVCQNYERI